MKKLLLLLTLLVVSTTTNSWGAVPWNFTQTTSSYTTANSNDWSFTNTRIVTYNSNYYPALTGNTTKKGTVTSPTLKDGISSLKIGYVNTFSDTKAGFDIEIYQNGSVAKKLTFTDDNASQNTVGSQEWTNLGIKGDFTIKITNNSPSNSTSHKDRTAIIELSWKSNAALGDITVSYSGGDVTENSTVTVPNGTVFNIAADNATSIRINGTETSRATATYTATTSETVNVSATDGTATKEFSFTTDVYTAPDAPIFTVDGVSTGVENGYFYGAKLSMTGTGSIYYTTDGSTPSATEDTRYSEAIALAEGTTTYKAIVNDGSHDSAVTSAAYTVKKLSAAWSVADGTEVYPGTEITATANAEAAKIFINGAEATSYTIPETAAIGSEITLSAYATVEADNATVTSETATITVKVVEQPTEVVINTNFFGSMAASTYKAYSAEDDFATYATVMNYQNSKLYWNTKSNNGCGLIINCKSGYYIESIDINSPSAYVNVFTSENAYAATTDLANASKVGQITTATNAVSSYSFTGTPQYVGLRPNGTSSMNFVSITIHYKKFGSDKPAIKLAWSAPNFTTDIVSKDVADAPALTVTAPDGMTEAEAKALVKYESSKPSVATIGANGTLEILGLGATEIKAYIDDTNYQSEEATYTLIVTDPNAATATDRLDLEAFGFTQNTYVALTYTSPATGILYSACGMKNSNTSYSGGITINSSMSGSKSAYPGIAVTTNDTGWKVKSITIKWFGSINPSVQLHIISSSDHGYAMNEANPAGEQFGFREVWTNEQPATNGASVPVPESLSTPVTLNYDPYSADAISFFGIFASNLHSIEYIDIKWVREATPEVKILSEDNTSITVGVEHADYILHYKKIHNDNWNNHWGDNAAQAPARVAQNTTDEPLADSDSWVSTGANQVTIDKTVADHQNRHYKFTAFHKDDTALANELNHVNFLIDGDGTLTGIEGVEAEAGADAPAEYYDLQGRRVANPVSGLYIRRTGSKVEKVLVK